MAFYVNRVDASEEFDPKLEFLAPYMGTWQAAFKSKNGAPSVIDVSMWERALNGKAIRTLH